MAGLPTIMLPQKMKHTAQYLCCLSVITLALFASACDGRHADATPNGETIEVSVTQVDSANSSTAPDSTQVAEDSGSVVMSVTSNMQQ